MIYDYKDVEQILERVEEYRKNAIDEISLNILIANNNSLHSVPNAPEKIVRVTGMYAGELNRKVEQEIIQPLLEFAKPIKDLTEVLPYVDMQKRFDSYFKDGFSIEAVSLFFKELSEEAIKLLLEELDKTSIPVSYNLFELHGKMNRISKYDSAFTIRDGSYLLSIEANVGNHPEETHEWIKNMYEKLLPYSYDQASYLNSASEDDEVIRNTYKCIHSHLVKLKKEYDPENLFCSEHKLI